MYGSGPQICQDTRGFMTGKMVTRLVPNAAWAGLLLAPSIPAKLLNPQASPIRPLNPGMRGVQMAGLKEQDLLFVRYERGSQHTECLPYYIALDHETKSVGEGSCLVARQCTVGTARADGT